MKSYNNETVLYTAGARLVPPNHNYPDCLCLLLLTEEWFYALEDNCNGTYTEHIRIPRHKVTHVIEEVNFPPGEKEVKSEKSYLATALMGLFGGIVVFPGRKERKRQENTYMKITYIGDHHKQEILYFSDFQFGVGAFIKKFSPDT